jgi:hypothetical protein
MTNFEEENYIEFMKSLKAIDLFTNINYTDLLNIDVNEIKLVLDMTHIDTPHKHTNHTAYILNTILHGMYPESKYSTIPDNLKPDVIDFFKVLVNLKDQYITGSIGEFIKKLIHCISLSN